MTPTEREQDLYAGRIDWAEFRRLEWADRIAEADRDGWFCRKFVPAIGGRCHGPGAVVYIGQYDVDIACRRHARGYPWEPGIPPELDGRPKKPPRPPKPTPMAPSRIRPLRGLLIQWRRHKEQAERMPGFYSVIRPDRGLFGTFAPLRRRNSICRWCEEPCDPGRAWHQECVPWYWCATGQQAGIGGQPLIPRTGVCAECGANTTGQLDHRLAIGVARLLGERAWLRAHMLTNLQWLCSDCHLAKTAQDLARMSELRGNRPRPRPQEPSNQPALFPLGIT